MASPTPQAGLESVMRHGGRGWRRMAEAHGNVRDNLRRAGFETHDGPLEANQPVLEVIAKTWPSPIASWHEY